MLTVLSLNLAEHTDHDRAFDPGDERPEPGRWLDRLPLIVQAIIDHRPDVIGLCEARFDAAHPSVRDCGAFWQRQGVQVDDCARMDMAQQVMTLLQARSAHYADAVLLTDRAMIEDEDCWEGQATISRLPVLDHGMEQLSQGTEERTRRIAQWVRLRLPAGEDFWFHNGHLSTDPEWAARNAEEVLELIRPHIHAKALLVGDMNADTDSKAFHLLADSGLKDLWKLLGQGEGLTFQPWNPVKRFDYCWASPSLAATAREMALFGAAPAPVGGGTYLSDHLGTVTRFET